MPYKKEKKNHQFLALDESRQQEHAKKTQKVKIKKLFNYKLLNAIDIITSTPGNKKKRLSL